MEREGVGESERGGQAAGLCYNLSSERKGAGGGSCGNGESGSNGWPLLEAPSATPTDRRQRLSR